MSSTQSYDHVQRGRFHWLVYAIAALSLWAGIAILNGTMEPESGSGDAALWIFFVMAALMLLLGMSFQYMRVRDCGDALEINFGPLPLLRKQVRYADITSVTRARTSWLDGWGIHLMLGRGWTWNLWGRDCAELSINGSRFRVGTDDADGLVSFLEERIGYRG
jgi:hypothetical protein